MQIPIITKELALRLSQAEAIYRASRLLGMTSIPGNPMTAEVQRFGGAVALSCSIKEGLFNRVLGFKSEETGLLGDILDWTHERGNPCRLDIVPYLVEDETLVELARRGLSQTGFKTVFYGVPSKNEFFSETVSVKRVTGDLWPVFINVFLEANNFPEAIRDVVGKNVVAQYEQPGWHTYTAFVHDIPAGIGVMHVDNGVGSLSLAITLERLRGNGCQSALLGERISHAAELGCDLVTSQALHGTISQRNMQRTNLQVAYTAASWSELQSL